MAGSRWTRRKHSTSGTDAEGFHVQTELEYAINIQTNISDVSLVLRTLAPETYVC